MSDTPSNYQPLSTASNKSISSSPTTSIASFPTVLRMRSIKHFDASTLTTEKFSAASNKKFPTPKYEVPTSSNKVDYRVTVRSASISGGGIVVVKEKKIETPEITYLSKTPTSASGGGVVVVQNNPPPSSTSTIMRTSGGGIVAQRSSPTSPATMLTLRSKTFHGGCFVRIGEKSNATPVEPRLEIDLARIGIDFQRMTLESKKHVLDSVFLQESKDARDNNKSDRASRRRQHSAPTVMDSFENTYADLLPLNILDDDGDEGQQSKVDANDGTEGPALTPVKEDVAPRDLRSYFKGKLLFDEPESPPIIEVVQCVRDDLFVAMRKKQPRKFAKPATRTRKKQQERKSSPRKKQLRRRRPKNPERTVPCDSCNRTFVTLRHMRIHAATHSRNRRKISCRLCPRKFVNEGALVNHMRSHKKVA